MFCMNCGQQLPDGAKYCLQCGTPQGAVSPTGTTQAETINLDGMHSFVPAMCPNCNAHMKVDTSSKVARCDTCGTECLVQDAIRSLSVKGNVRVNNATINVIGTKAEEKYDFIFKSYGNSKMDVIKAVMVELGMGIKEAKALVEGAPSTLRTNITMKQAESLLAKLASCGGEFEIKPSTSDPFSTYHGPIYK